MSDLLLIAAAGEFDSAEFIDRLAGLYRHAEQISGTAKSLAERTAKRIEGIRFHTFKALAEVGESLLMLQDARPGEFESWFSVHEEALGFSLRSAERCKAAAREVREHGMERAYARALEAQEQQRVSVPTVRVPLELGAIEKIPREKAKALLEKIEPVCLALRERVEQEQE